MSGVLPLFSIHLYNVLLRCFVSALFKFTCIMIIIKFIHILIYMLFETSCISKLRQGSYSGDVTYIEHDLPQRSNLMSVLIQNRVSRR